MALPWVRLDANIASHDKVLALVSSQSRVKWQAFGSYICSLGWSGGQGTDGYVPASALAFVHGTTATARLLVKHGLWEEAVGGWRIRNWEQRQQLSLVTDTILEAKQKGAAKGNCVRWHGKDCGCWQRLA